VERAAPAAAGAARAEIAREQHARAAVAEERARIARELHDTVAHAVSVMVLHAGAVRSRLPEELRSEREGLTRTEDAGRHAIGELHRMLGVLRDQHDVQDQGALAAPPTLTRLDELLEASRRTGLTVHLTIEGEPPDLTRSSRAVDLSAYRILQEALTNVRKHARATTVWVRIAYGDGGIRLRVVDDGVGTVDGVRTGHGLVGIRERVEVFGGELRVTTPRSGGYQLEVALPGGSR
jgi:signal transduction histidine kinase